MYLSFIYKCIVFRNDYLVIIFNYLTILPVFKNKFAEFSPPPQMPCPPFLKDPQACFSPRKEKQTFDHNKFNPLVPRQSWGLAVFAKKV